MPMKPKPGESQNDFMERCVPEMMDTAAGDNEQAVAICMDIWRRRKDAPDSGVVHKTQMAVSQKKTEEGLEYVLSDESVDRMGDVIEQSGWVLSDFKKNPIALFNHDKNFPVGRWRDVRVDKTKKQLVGRLELLPKGISQRIDEIIAAVENGVLRAVSVGFRPIRDAIEQLENGGVRFTKQHLLEVSLVSVPANANALQIARSLDLSPDVMSMIFGEKAGTDRGITNNGVNARTSKSKTGTSKMTPLSQRVEAAEQRLTQLRDQLKAVTEKITTDEISQELQDEIAELNKSIESATKTRDVLKASETAMGLTAPHADEVDRSMERQGAGASGVERLATRPSVPAAAATKLLPRDHIIRSMVVRLISHVHKRNPIEVLHEIYGENRETEKTKLAHDFVTRAASAPATMTTSGWASQLVQTINADFMETLIPGAAYPSLAARGLRLGFGRAGQISIPFRASTPTIAGSFVGEGSPIPVRQGAFSSASLTPKKMAVITTFTREIAEYSIPAIEGLLRDAIQEDTSVAIDTVLLDATAASAIRPAGIRNGVTVTTATAGGGFAALVGDIKALIGALLTATNGNVRVPVWLMNPIQQLAISLTQNAGGDFPFAAEVNGNQLRGYPLITSPNVPAGMIILLDAADFVSVTGDDPRFDVSDQAVLHMEDTTPLAIGTTGSPATVAAPARSLFQTDSLALRMILPMNWTIRRTGVLAWTQSVTW